MEWSSTQRKICKNMKLKGTSTPTGNGGYLLELNETSGGWKDRLATLGFSILAGAATAGGSYLFNKVISLFEKEEEEKEKNPKK